MVKVEITEYLFKKIEKTFSKAEANTIIDLLEALEKNPYKGKSLTNVSEFVIKELKYKKYRFYFITDGFMLKFGTKEELTDLLIKFVEMSEKKDQEKAITQVKEAIRKIGFDEF